MEVMVSLAVFSILIALSGRFIATGVKQPFVTERVEPWLVFLEETSLALESLEKGAEISAPGVHPNPFPLLEIPQDLDSWKLEWVGSDLPGVKLAVFSATTRQKQTIEWKIFKESP